MNPITNKFVSTLEFEDYQQFENMGVFPLFSPVEANINYITLPKALKEGLIRVREMDMSGSVPNLTVTNKAEIPVFLLDGEELAGAKQNRVINTSILLKEKSDTIIPVSCTEEGRWSYTSDEFYDSGILMERNMRARKSAAVSHSIKYCRTYESNQGEIWDDIKNMSYKENVHSSTSAMKDVYKKKMKDLDEYMKSFSFNPRQNGILVIINGKVAGCDLLSLSPAYEELHPKIIKSYAMDAIIQGKRKNGNGQHSYDDAVAFFDQAKRCDEEKIESVGYGWDYRFDGNNIVGSSLLHEDEVIHMSLFKTSNSDKTGNISSMSRRRRFRS